MNVVGKIKVSRVVSLGERRMNGCKRIISRVPLNVITQDLVENL